MLHIRKPADVLVCWMLFAGLLAVAVSAVVPAGGVSAQSPPSQSVSTFVGNTGQADGVATSIGGTGAVDLAQAFTTGGNAGGYVLTRAQVEFAAVGALLDTSVAVGVFTESSGEPGSSIGSLTDLSSRVSNSDQLVSFGHPFGIDLKASTTYFLVLDTSSSVHASTSVRNTASDAEDAGASAGWSIADNIQSRLDGTTGTWSTGAQSLKLRLSGVERRVGCATADSADGSYEVPYDWALKPSSLLDGDKFRLLFVSQSERDGSSSAIADYNTHVQTAAKDGHWAISDACGDLFTAVASTSAVDARVNTSTESSDTDASIWWLGGCKVATNYADFYDQTWDCVQIHRNESGLARGRNNVLTGSNSDGTKHATEHLGNSTTLVRFGLAAPLFDPINRGRITKTVVHRFYGLSPVFKVEQRPTVSLQFAGPVVLEGGDAVQLVVQLSEANSTGAALSVPVRVKAAGTTASSSDYSFAGSVSIADGALSGRVDFTAADDDVDEPDETVTVELGTLPEVWVADEDASEAAVTITDDDATVVSVSSSDTVLTEQDASDTASLRVRLGRRLFAGEQLRVDLGYGDVSGVVIPENTDPSFSVSVSGTGVTATGLSGDPALLFAGHDVNTVQEAEVVLTPTGTGDADADDGSFSLGIDTDGFSDSFTNLSGGAAAHPDDDEVSFAFADDEPKALVGFVSDRVVASEASGQARVPVALDAVLDRAVTVRFADSAGTASAPGDYTAGPYEVSFPAGTTEGEVVVPVTADSAAEGSESFTLSVDTGSLPSGVAVGEVSEAEVVLSEPASGCYQCVWVVADPPGGVDEGGELLFTVLAHPAPPVDLDVSGVGARRVAEQGALRDGPLQRPHPVFAHPRREHLCGFGGAHHRRLHPRGQQLCHRQAVQRAGAAQQQGLVSGCLLRRRRRGVGGGPRQRPRPAAVHTAPRAGQHPLGNRRAVAAGLRGGLRLFLLGCVRGDAAVGHHQSHLCHRVHVGTAGSAQQEGRHTAVPAHPQAVHRRGHPRRGRPHHHRPACSCEVGLHHGSRHQHRDHHRRAEPHRPQPPTG